MTREEKKAYRDRIRPLQNHPANENQDHMTITGFFDTPAEFERHIGKLEDAIAAYR